MLTISSFAFAQMKVKGMVVDSKGQALTGVIIMARNKDTGKMVHYAKSDAGGKFEIDVATNNYLEFSLLGFAKCKIENISEKDAMRVVMNEEAITLKEVSVKADKVSLQGDTINYNISTYADSKDRSVGDVLARIPGFEVTKETGKITYEGRDISKFYIEGLDMLGEKYGVATNTLPQVDVGSVQVLKHHQPVKALEDFTYTDETAVNIRMKESAKSRWVASFNAGTGWSDDDPLLKFEGFGLRLRQKQQTMITYKTNNTGENISGETTSLFSLSDLEDAKNNYISLEKPTTSSLKESRTLFNRNHSFTLNNLRKLGKTSQLNLQMVYNHDRETAYGDKETTYYLTDGNRNVNNHKAYKSKEDELYTQLKYEDNSGKSYLKNQLSSDFTWKREWLNETGTHPNTQYTKFPDITLKDNFYALRRFGNKLISFFSDNKFISRKPSLVVDSLQQHVAQRYFTTDTYVMGGTRIGRFSLTLKTGFNANIHSLETEAYGLPDTLGTSCGESKFWSVKFYVDPTLLYKISDFNFSVSPQTEYVYEKSRDDKGNSRILFSPSAKLNWTMTALWKLSLGGSITTEPLDASRFYNTLILQDFQYLNQGYNGYRHTTSKAVRGLLVYSNALRALHASFNLSRTFSTIPYTATRRFVDDYIILSAIEQETKANSWRGILSLSKGVNFWRGIFNVNVAYLNNNSTIIQNAIPMDCSSKMLTLKAGFDFSFWQDMHVKYNLNYSRNQMEMAAISTTTNITNWKHMVTLEIPIKTMTVKIDNEYYRNELANGTHKNFLLTDVGMGYKVNHFDITLALRNLFNHDTFAYMVNNELISTFYSNKIRPREVLLSFYYNY